MRRSIVLGAVLSMMSLATVMTARADNRPTSGDMSIISGRTLGNDYTVLAAGVGWPSVWAGVWFSPSSVFNFGIRASVLYGSPIMGFPGGVGGELSLPARLHIVGKGSLDVSIALTPAVSIGQGSLEGQENAFSDEFGYSARVESGLLAGAQLSRAVTFTLGVMGQFGYLNVPDPDAGESAAFFGGVLAVAGVELLVSRDTMIFVEAHGGYGFVSEDLYATKAIGRIWLGLAYLL